MLVVCDDPDLRAALVVGLQRGLASEDADVRSVRAAHHAVALEWPPSIVVSGPGPSGPSVLATVASQVPSALRILIIGQREGLETSAPPGLAHARFIVADGSEETGTEVAAAILARLPTDGRPRGDLSHDLGTPLTVLVTSLGLMTNRLKRLPPDDPEVVAAAELNMAAIDATEALVRVLENVRRQNRVRDALAPGVTISHRSHVAASMGDARFDRHWASWERALHGRQSARYLADEPVENLVELLASSQASRDPLARNVLASALSNRLRPLQPPPELDQASLWVHLTQTRERVALGRSLVADSRLLTGVKPPALHERVATTGIGP